MYGISRLKKLVTEEKFILKTINEGRLIFPIYILANGKMIVQVCAVGKRRGKQ